jgi:hypothetical protein
VMEVLGSRHDCWSWQAWSKHMAKKLRLSSDATDKKPPLRAVWVGGNVWQHRCCTVQCSDLLSVDILWRSVREAITDPHGPPSFDDLEGRVADFQARIHYDPIAVADRRAVKDPLDPTDIAAVPAVDVICGLQDADQRDTLAGDHSPATRSSHPDKSRHVV